jgi:hypothetical protein
MHSTTDFLIEAGISPEVIALVPGPIALEHTLLPFAATEKAISILFAEQPNEELRAKLGFIFRREVRPALGRRAAILAAIEHYYGDRVYETLPSAFISTTDWKLRCDSEED